MKSCDVTMRRIGPSKVAGVVGFVCAAALVVRAQEQSAPLTLLPAPLLAAIAGEVSGAQAFAHTVDLVGYEHDRPADEYGEGTYREAAYMAAKAREFTVA